jgi:hypothetical protein
MRGRQASNFLGVVGVLLALTGLAIGFFGYVREPLANWWGVRDWKPLEATLHPTKTRPEARSSLRGVEYRYEFGGKTFAGQRIGHYDHRSGPPFDENHVLVRTRVAQMQRDRETIRVWVDPRRPQSAMIDRSVKTEGLLIPLLVTSFVTLLGLALAIGGLSRTSARRADLYGPPRPLTGSSRSPPWLIWLMALCWNVFMAIVISEGVGSRTTPSPFALLVVGFFGLLGVGLVWLAIAATLAHLRYRDSVLELDPFPVRTGGACRGSATVPIPFVMSHSFKAELAATKYASRYPLEGVSQEVVHRQQAAATAAYSPDGTLVGFEFRLPPDAPASDGYGEDMVWTRATRTRTYLQWTVAVSADVPGVDLNERFEIPVVRAESAAHDR